MVRLHRPALFAAALLLLLAFGRPGTTAAFATGSDLGEPGVDYVDGRLLVQFAPGTSAAARAAAHARAGGRVERTIPAIGVQVVNVGRGRVPAAVAVYARNPNVRFVEPDLVVRATIDCTGETGTFSDDPCSWRQWGLDNTGQDWGEGSGTADADIDAPEAWAAGARGAGTVIAVLDTGYDTSHPDLVPRVEASSDFTGTGIEDGHGHGTWTASLAAAATANELGMAGTAPDARLIVGKVLDDAGSGSWSQVAEGIVWATDYGVQQRLPTVISMSLGGECRRGRFFFCQTLREAVEYAAGNGALLVAAAGNSGSAKTEYPGAFPEVLAVAATDDDDQVASFSNLGDVAAPGVRILGAFPDCDDGSTFTLQANGIDCSYDYGSGTSAATPLVAGAAALAWSAVPSASAEDVRRALTESAEDIPGTDFDGAGRITACGAIAALGATCEEAGSEPEPPPVGYVLRLEGSSTSEGRTWTASVTTTLSRDGSPVEGGTISGSWSTGTETSCTTGSDGSCGISLDGIPKRTRSVTFTVTAVTIAGSDVAWSGDRSVEVMRP